MGVAAGVYMIAVRAYGYGIGSISHVYGCCQLVTGKLNHRDGVVILIGDISKGAVGGNGNGSGKIANGKPVAISSGAAAAVICQAMIRKSATTGDNRRCGRGSLFASILKVEAGPNG